MMKITYLKISFVKARELLSPNYKNMFTRKDNKFFGTTQVKAVKVDGLIVGVLVFNKHTQPIYMLPDISGKYKTILEEEYREYRQTDII